MSKERRISKETITMIAALLSRQEGLDVTDEKVRNALAPLVNDSGTITEIASKMGVKPDTLKHFIYRVGILPVGQRRRRNVYSVSAVVGAYNEVNCCKEAE